MAAAAKKAATVRIAPFRSVVIDGRAREAGELVAVSNADAQTLIADGYAVDPNAADDEQAPAAPAGLDEDSSHEERGRRMLTPAAIDNDEEERGR